MKRTILLTAGGALLLASAVVFGQSLADIAKKEKERRATIKVETKVITDSDREKYSSGAITTSSTTKGESNESETANTESDTSKEPATAGANPDEPVDFSGRPESFWRQTMADARQKVTTLENEATALTLRLANLQNQFYSEASGYRQQDIQREIQKTYYEQDVNKKNLEEARKSLSDLQDDARKSGALPGWLEPKSP